MIIQFERYRHGPEDQVFPSLSIQAEDSQEWRQLCELWDRVSAGVLCPGSRTFWVPVHVAKENINWGIPYWQHYDLPANPKPIGMEP